MSWCTVTSSVSQTGWRDIAVTSLPSTVQGGGKALMPSSSATPATSAAQPGHRRPAANSVRAPAGIACNQSP